jgi:type I restriction enzyme M protein
MKFDVVEVKQKPSQVSASFHVSRYDGENYIFCPVRQKAFKVSGKPEELVRQWWLYRLAETYGYSFDQMGVEVPVTVGSTEAKKKADIVVYTNNTKAVPRIFVEVKQPTRIDGVEQLKVYMNATGTGLGVWSNGTAHTYLLRLNPKSPGEDPDWRELRNIPGKQEKLADVDSPLLRRDLEPTPDFLSVVRECENYIKAHEGTDAFDELFKLIFSKLFDERTNLKNDNSAAHFRIGVLEKASDARERIEKLFRSAKTRWSGVFDAGEEIALSDEALAFCVSALQRIYLLRSRADILGAAFEVMVNPTMKGDKGQYFTPRHVIKLCIDVLNPSDQESVLDPACGSGGFLIGAMDHVFRKIREARDDESEILENQKDYANECVFGIDYDRLIAKVAKAYMLIWGDGRSNIATSDALNETNWPADVLSKFTTTKGGKRHLRQYDIVITNPPFAGDVGADDTISKYDLAFKPQANGGRKRVNKISRDKLFIERCLNMLAPGGRMAIVLPRGILKNYSDEYIRRFILVRAKIKGAVALTGDMFKPFTNTKTCVLFLQKRAQPLKALSQIPKSEKSVFCVSERPGKNKSGLLIQDDKGNVISDLDDIAAYMKKHVKFD